MPGTSRWWGKGVWKAKLNGCTDDCPECLTSMGRKAMKEEKAAPGGYRLFMTSEMAKVSQEHPSLDRKAVFKKAFEAWQAKKA